MKARKPNHKVFEWAMGRVATGEAFCCAAIDRKWALGFFRGDPSAESLLFRRIFKNNQPIMSVWWDEDDIGSRIIALQLAACIAKDGGL
jgi:hypothetical protein